MAHKTVVGSIVSILIFCGLISHDLYAQQTFNAPNALGEKASPEFRVPGEFEPQDAILLAANDLLQNNSEILLDIAHLTKHTVEILLLVSSAEQTNEVRHLFQQGEIDDRHIRIVEIDHDTMWTRDYGPVSTVSRRGKTVLVDADYSFDRMKDDESPIGLAEILGQELRRIPLRIDGGNLLFSGEGLALTTEKFWEDNSELGISQQSMVDLLGDAYGVQKLVTLAPLLGEPTGHVDMFATFVSRNTVVVGKYDPKVEPENADVLDHNASVLANVTTDSGPLRVVRVPMPQRDGEVWRTYTNVIFANGLLLVPSYPDTDQSDLPEVLSSYRQLLPDWKVETVDSSTLIQSGGSLHCISMNLGRLGEIRLEQNSFLARLNDPRKLQNERWSNRTSGWLDNAAISGFQPASREYQRPRLGNGQRGHQVTEVFAFGLQQ